MKNETLKRLPNVMGQTSLPRSTVWLYVSLGKFPKPIRLSSRITVWKQSDIDLFISDPQYCVENRPWIDGGKYAKVYGDAS